MDAERKLYTEKEVVVIRQLPFSLEELKKKFIETSPKEIFHLKYSKEKPCWTITQSITKFDNGVSIFADTWADKSPLFYTWERLYSEFSVGGIYNIRF